MYIGRETRGRVKEINNFTGGMTGIMAAADQQGLAIMISSPQFPDSACISQADTPGIMVMVAVT
jgi:hypothetical protein